METEQASKKRTLKKGTKFLVIHGSKTDARIAFKDVPVDVISQKMGETYFQLGKMVCRGLLASILVLLCGILPALAGSIIPKVRAVNAIIGEAEGESYRGKLAVACAIRNRGTLNGVYGEYSKRVKEHLYGAKVFVDTVRAWEESADLINCQFIDGADHWEGTAFPIPKWAVEKKVTAIVGNQRFYRDYYESEEQEMIDRRHGL